VLCCAVQVGLGGPSGSGKTAFSERVKEFMPGICVISMDNYNDSSKLIDGWGWGVVCFGGALKRQQIDA
jgi:Ni2+-binding GTPase involved in maturation of urease and hydrogenase